MLCVGGKPLSRFIILAVQRVQLPIKKHTTAAQTAVTAADMIEVGRMIGCFDPHVVQRNALGQLCNIPIAEIVQDRLLIIADIGHGGFGREVFHIVRDVPFHRGASAVRGKERIQPPKVDGIREGLCRLGIVRLDGRCHKAAGQRRDDCGPAARSIGHQDDVNAVLCRIAPFRVLLRDDVVQRDERAADIVPDGVHHAFPTHGIITRGLERTVIKEIAVLYAVPIRNEIIQPNRAAKLCF